MKRLLLALAFVTLAACGGKSSSMLVCQPACPPGSRCTDSGCIPDEPIEPPDLAVTGDGGGCFPACAGATPFCSDGTCVACLKNDQCPVGQVCRKTGATAACLPGCADDSRCGGGTSLCCDGACTDTASDAANCGGCSQPCSAQHAAASCVEGRCSGGACEAGWGDCNRDPADGCETSLRSDAKNCGGCGVACGGMNAIAACADGCYIAGCAFGWDDCDTDARNGCEKKVLDDPKNCGRCGVSCGSLPHARNTCVNAACQLSSCDFGFADCDGNLVNGCEINIGSDVKSCGACGVACIPGVQVCIGGTCTCPPCTFPHAMSGCVNNQCVLVQCNQGFADCDGDTRNGCELPVAADVKNCGACGNVCAQGLVCQSGGCTCPQCNFANAKSKCINNVCMLDACFVGYGDCDKNPQNGCEVNLNADSANCSACGVACPQNTPYCTGGKCNNILTSCLAYFQMGGQQSGQYMIDPDGNGPLPAVQVYCDMGAGGQTVYSVTHNWGEWGQNMTIVMRDLGNPATGSINEWQANCQIFGKANYGGMWHNDGGTYSEPRFTVYNDAADWWMNNALKVFPDATYDKIVILQDALSTSCWAWYAEAGSLQAFGSPVGGGFAFCRNGNTASERFHIYICNP